MKEARNRLGCVAAEVYNAEVAAAGDCMYIQVKL